MAADRSIAFYLQPGPMTALGRHAVAFAGVKDVAALAELVHGVLLHQHWARAYGQTLSPERLDLPHLRRSRDLLDAALRLDPAPLTTSRPPERRAVGVCSHFSALAAGALRALGVPARSRCGFGMYFEPGKGVDHWIVEYRDGDRWVTADFQIDDLQAKALKLDFDPLDQPKGHFLRAGEAWQAARRGELDPDSCGIFDEGGYWFIAQNMMRDLASLNHMEMLPWDVWGMMPEPSDEMSPETFETFDRLAELTLDVDRNLDALRQLYQGEERLRVPSEVRNAVRRQMEPVFPG